MPGHAYASGAWISTQCLTNSSWEIPGLRDNNEALLIIEPDAGLALRATSPADANAVTPAKPMMVRRRVAGVTLLSVDIRSPMPLCRSKGFTGPKRSLVR